MLTLLSQEDRYATLRNYDSDILSRLSSSVEDGMVFVLESGSSSYDESAKCVNEAYSSISNIKITSNVGRTSLGY